MDYSFLQKLIAIDSPSGFTQGASEFVFNQLRQQGCQPRMTNKGAVVCSFHPNPVLAIAAHLDTLGAVVSKVNHDGTLSFSMIGGLSLTGAEGEYVRIHTLSDQTYTGTILLNNPSTHANREKDTTQRTLGNMHIRIDEPVQSRYDTANLGIRVGDFICLNPRYEEHESGFIKSRFLDNKAGCLVLFELARSLQRSGAPVELFFSNYEEVGHGGTCGFSPSIEELLVIDMGVVGVACDGTEMTCSICAKDSTGPYDYRMRRQLVQLAEKKKIPYTLDVYPYYGSDGSAALSAGNDFRVALLGPGVAASHSTERTHKQGIQATFDLCQAYIENIH